MSYFHLLEPLLSYGSKLYLIASELFTVSVLLWMLSFMANCIEKVYLAGKVVGNFYHRHQLGSRIKELVVHLIASVVFLLGLTIDGAKVVRRDYKEWLANANQFRNQVGSLFTLPEVIYV